MKKLNKGLITIVLCVSMLVSSLVTCYASTTTITLKLSTTKATSTLYYQYTDKLLSVELYVYEKSKTTGKTIITTGSSSAKGVAERTAFCTADSGYEFTEAWSFGYLSGEMIASAYNGSPS